MEEEKGIKQKTVLYINRDGALKNMEDEDIISLVKQGDISAMDFILDKYKPLVKSKSRAYFLIGADNEDIIQEGMIGLYKAVRDFNPDKHASFKAFAELCVNRQIITAVKAATRQKHQPLNNYVSLNKPLFLAILHTKIFQFLVCIT